MGHFFRRPDAEEAAEINLQRRKRYAPAGTQPSTFDDRERSRSNYETIARRFLYEQLFSYARRRKNAPPQVAPPVIVSPTYDEGRRRRAWFETITPRPSYEWTAACERRRRYSAQPVRFATSVENRRHRPSYLTLSPRLSYELLFVIGRTHRRSYAGTPPPIIIGSSFGTIIG